MGLRMYVSKAEDKDNWDNCYGKCYGYNRNTHLYSLDYLCSINAFKDWKLNLWDTADPSDMEEYFCIAQSTEEIYLTKGQFKRFILLYQSDQLSAMGNYVNDIFEVEDENIVKIEWG